MVLDEERPEGGFPPAPQTLCPMGMVAQSHLSCGFHNTHVRISISRTQAHTLGPPRPSVIGFCPCYSNDIAITTLRVPRISLGLLALTLVVFPSFAHLTNPSSGFKARSKCLQSGKSSQLTHPASQPSELLVLTCMETP